MTGSWVLDGFLVGCVVLVLVPLGACVRAARTYGDGENQGGLS